MKRLFYSFIWLLVAVPCQADIITVDDNGPADFNNIQAAINDANNGDIIEVKPGTYAGNGNRDIDFGGRSIMVRSTNPNDPNIVAATIIDCNGTESEPHRGFYFHNNEDTNSILNGLRITNGWAAFGGGGIYCESTSPMIINCNITYNTGGAIHIFKGNSLITNCKITNNSAYGGAGISLYKSNSQVLNCNISGNNATYYSGGIDCYEANAIVRQCNINNNSAGWEGGGIGLYKSHTSIINCIISENTAEDGAGICVDQSSPTITSTLIAGNLALRTGGGMICYSNFGIAAPLINNCTITENYVVNNSPDAGSGLWFERGTDATMTNCIVSDNLGSPNNIQISLSPDKSHSEQPSPPPILTLNYTDVENAPNAIYIEDSNCVLNWNSTTITTPPDFVIPGYWDINGTPGDPNDDFWVDGDYHLKDNSPCINSGDPNYIKEPNETDLDGNPRISESRIDMGAYETALTLPDPIALLDILSQYVNDLSLHQGIENSLLAKLNTAIQKLTDDNENNDVSAFNSLLAFVNAVEAQYGKKIKETDADNIIASVQEIVYFLGDE